MMKKSFNFLFALLVILLMSSKSSIYSHSQTTPISYNYNVKVGDSNTYMITRASSYTYNYFRDGFPLENGSSLAYNATQGITIKVQVTTINQSSENTEQVFITMLLSIPGKGIFISPVGSSFGFIHPAFSNLTSAQNYYNLAFSYLVTPSFSIQGDFISLNSKFTNYNNNLTSSYTQIFSLRTGWLEEYDLKNIFANGTMLTNYQLKRESGGLINNLFNYTIIGLGLSAIAVVTVIVVIIALKFKKY